jgi:hypothetical protein
METILRGKKYRYKLIYNVYLEGEHKGRSNVSGELFNFPPPLLDVGSKFN